MKTVLKLLQKDMRLMFCGGPFRKSSTSRKEEFNSSRDHLTIYRSGDLDARCARISKTEKHPSSVQFDIPISQTIIKQDILQPTHLSELVLDTPRCSILNTLEYRRRSGETSYLHFVKTATVPMAPDVNTSNFHDISNVHVQSKWKYCDRPKIENWNGASEKLFLIHIYSESLPEQV
ncbi:unnamed protein product, partial [Nesidiocoris tenuis]